MGVSADDKARLSVTTITHRHCLCFSGTGCLQAFGPRQRAQLALRFSALRSELYLDRSAGVDSRMDRPSAPPRAVRPLLWTYTSADGGTW